MIDPGLEDKVVCITGANNPKGIGAATARAFAAQGAAVFLHFFRQAERSFDEHALEQPGEAYYRRAQTLNAQHLIDEIRSVGGRAEACEIDFRDAAASSTDGPRRACVRLNRCVDQ